MKKIIFLSLIFISTIGFSQQYNSLYFTPNLPQANQLNPAIQNTCKIEFNGLLIPITGQLFAPIDFTINNNNLSYKDVIHHGTGAQADSLVFDIPNVLKKIKKLNYTTINLDVEYLNIGYKWEKWFFTFNLSDRFESKLRIPHDLIQFFYEGNGKSFMEKPADFSGISLLPDMTYYRDYSIGASKVINSQWTVGGRLHMLFGKFNTELAKSNITFKTDSEDYAYTFTTDIEYNVSQPYFTIDTLDYNYDADSLIFSSSTNDSLDPKEIIMNRHNMGMGIDLGGIYTINDKIKVYASLLDFGFIRWKTNPQQLKVIGTYTYDGVDAVPFLKGDSAVFVYQDETLDSVVHAYQPQLEKEAYTTYLTAKVYIGGTYKYNDKVTFGALGRVAMYRYLMHPSLTLSANSQLLKWLGGTASVTVMNNQFTNVGLGLVIKGGPVQLFLASDNIWGFVWPQSARNFNFRWGMNWRFGCSEKEDNSKL